jgi:hypothetical protein
MQPQAESGTRRKSRPGRPGVFTSSRIRYRSENICWCWSLAVGAVDGAFVIETMNAAAATLADDIPTIAKQMTAFVS